MIGPGKRSFSEWTFPEKIFFGPLLVPVFAYSMLLMLLILVPVATVNGVWYAFYWARFKVRGTPIPPKFPYNI